MTEEAEVISMNLTPEIKYLEFKDFFLFRDTYLQLKEAEADIIQAGRHKYKETAWIIVFYWNEEW